ncbi:MAG TPA: hypothetical protein VFM19_08885 [Candidatus Limnocylindria bacterium]|nr:hypothetical protein [Candidatus Limnocylindria bacterium]
MTIESLVPGIIGAAVGVLGWLAVGIYIQRRQFLRQARSAARAVYFELDVNRTALMVARDLGSFTALDRSSFERLLPELATLLPAAELQTVVSAYMGHAGYQQASGDPQLPASVRSQLLDAILAAHDDALAVIRACAFSPAEAAALGTQGEEAVARPQPRRSPAR